MDAQYTLVGQSFAITFWLQKIVPFWDTCRGNVSQNETLRPTRVHNTLLSVKVPHSSYECGTFYHSTRPRKEPHIDSLFPASLPHRKLLVRNFVCNLRDDCGKDAGKIDAAAPGRTQISSRYTIVHPTTVIEVEIFDQKWNISFLRLRRASKFEPFKGDQSFTHFKTSCCLIKRYFLPCGPLKTAQTVTTCFLNFICGVIIMHILSDNNIKAKFHIIF